MSPISFYSGLLGFGFISGSVARNYGVDGFLIVWGVALVAFSFVTWLEDRK